MVSSISLSPNQRTICLVTVAFLLYHSVSYLMWLEMKACNVSQKIFGTLGASPRWPSFWQVEIFGVKAGPSCSLFGHIQGFLLGHYSLRLRLFAPFVDIASIFLIPCVNRNIDIPSPNLRCPPAPLVHL